jgi:hypothetical protein
MFDIPLSVDAAIRAPEMPMNRIPNVAPVEATFI